MLESIVIFSPGSNAGIPTISSSIDVLDNESGKYELTKIGTTGTSERVPEVTTTTRTRHSTRHLLRSTLLARQFLLSESRCDEIVVLCLVEEDLSQSTRTVLARLASLLDVAPFPLYESWSLEVGSG